ncbi:type II toxin-antitoxin system VapC family toxin [Desertivirga xinjiangensis]|uniref:type II toxin-antitoxin system VapC family toxin n=1 Tax=Desertivirga xinjiangensis TaxID=539206 RepID=UPI002109B42F|nr:type II toxin-antitoxin system VapC family toxin [Pedobacter xinjiangensis]
MIVFLDTCALFKLYHYEVDTDLFESIFTRNVVSEVFLSELTRIEFSSTLWKKVRTKEITQQQATKTVAAFNEDFDKFTFIPLDRLIINNAAKLIIKYGHSGLRTLDSIQLSTAVRLKNRADLFVTADK